MMYYIKTLYKKYGLGLPDYMAMTVVLIKRLSECLSITRDAIRSEQFEDGHFSKAYKPVNNAFKQILNN